MDILITIPLKSSLIIKLNRPEKRNAFNLELTVKAREVITKGCSDGNYRGIILTGEGKVFSAGLDLAEIYGFKTIDEAREYFMAIKSLVVALANCEKPVVALANGSTYGFGMEVLYFVDQAIAVRGSEFSLPGIRYGLVPVTPAFAPYLLGSLRTRFFFNRDFKLSTEEALNWGIIHGVVNDVNEGLNTALGIIEMMSSIPRNVYLEIRRLVITSMLGMVGGRWDELLETLARESIKPDVKVRLEEFLKR
ncbi:MAG: enoyl-CoA hydratase/isomerase family protein [Vulcanisaeta sp. AZ3]|jgi:enoyl-CoA hydratase/carnithine racemase